MTLTSRGKVAIAAVAVVLAVVVGVVVYALTGAAPDVLANAVDDVLPGNQVPQPCPLTGELLPGERDAPDRPVLGVKVENTDAAQPLAGLGRADIVYEEVVEGGITRFVALYHCQDAPRVGPVRSARTTDPKIMSPFNDDPLLAYSGGSNAVERTIQQSGLVAMTEDSASAAFTRDDAREVPHNLFAATKPLFREGRRLAPGQGPPAAAFVYEEELTARSKRAGVVTIEFSSLATAEWRWEGDRWVRYLDGAPMLLEDGEPIATDNIVIQVVKTTESDLTDVAGYPSPEITLTGSGKAWVLRDGRAVRARWERSDEGGFTTFTTRQGDEIPLAPGTTFVELAPVGMFDSQIDVSRR